MESEHPEDDAGAGAEQSDRGNPPAPQAPPDTSEHPPREEEIGGKGAEEDPGELGDEDRYRKGPGW